VRGTIGTPSALSALPLTWVPLELPRSRSSQPAPVHRISPCFSDTAGSLMCTRLAFVRPTVSTVHSRGGRSMTCPSAGPPFTVRRSKSGARSSALLSACCRRDAVVSGQLNRASWVGGQGAGNVRWM